ncbi:hypothetical protein BSL78_11036 [Apostichopus japonicus]|uniref:Uncharacterized protein n=1 Tax=Stichopus japonicus TaxID=307972 RepID=A0A2G8KVP4_STIJA|nr:hypothetical protein BSL78_11036 [Apostichopus japonicus]
MECFGNIKEMKEGILSSPERVDFIDPDGQTPEQQSANEEDNDTFDETSIAELESEESNGENPVANSSDDFRHLQQEVVDEIKRVMAQQSPVRMECITSPYDVRRRMAFISRRTPRYKLARKKELSLLNANARSFLPSSTSESDDGKSSGSSINPNYNRNASDFSSDCFSTQANSRNGSSLLMGTNSGSFIDSSHEKSSIHQAEQFPIQTMISTRRVFPSRRKDRYNALDHIPEYDRNNHLNNDRNGLPKVSTGSLPRCASNPNLIVIRPDSGQLEKEIEKEEIKLNSLTRSNSTPNVFSLTPPDGWDLHIDQYLQSTESSKGAKQTGLKQTGLKQTGLKQTGLKQTGLKQTGLKQETGRRNDVTFDTKDEKPPTENAANDVKSTKFKKDLEKEHKTNNVTTSQKNEAFSKRDCATDSTTRPRVTRYKYTLDRRRPLPNSCAPLNLNTVEGVRAKRKRFPEQSDPSFRGYGVKDKYHYYNRFSGNREEGSMKMDHGRGVPTEYSCDEDRRHLQPSVNQVRNGPSVANHAARDLPMTNRQKVEKTEGGIDHRTERNCQGNGKIDRSSEVNTEGAQNKYTYHFNGTSRLTRVGQRHGNTNGIPSTNGGSNNRNIGTTNNQSNGPTRFGTMGPTGPTGPMDPTRHVGPTRPNQCTGPSGPVRFQVPTGPTGPNGPARPRGPFLL